MLTDVQSLVIAEGMVNHSDATSLTEAATVQRKITSVGKNVEN